MRGTKLTRDQRKLLLPYGIKGNDWVITSIKNGKRVSGNGGRTRTDTYQLYNTVTQQTKTISVQMEY